MNFAEFPFPKNTFARVGMSYVTQRLSDPYKERMANLKGIRINTSSQPNANPHFGTVTTLMCVAAIAGELGRYFEKPVQITFDMLENAPDRKLQGIKRRHVNDQEIDYQISLADSYTENGTPLVEHNMRTFHQLFSFFESETGIAIQVRSYKDCQANPYFRKTLLSIFNDLEVFGPIVSPSGEVVRLRFPCPKCRWIDKGSVHTRIVSQTEDEIVFEALCPDHGSHRSHLAVDSTDYFGTNTPLRDIAKVPGLIEDGRKNHLLPLMIDGRDWSGRWDRCIHIPGVTRLGYDTWELPARIYTPVITDLLGAKLSKSLYVGNLYDYIPKGFADFNDFMETFGEEGLRTLWNHIRLWARDPAYMDRDSFTVLYFSLLLSGKLDNAVVLG